MDKYAQRLEELGSEWEVQWVAAGLHCPEEAAQGSSWAEDHCLGSCMAHRAKPFSFLQRKDSSKGPSNYPPRERGQLPSHRCVAGGGVGMGAAGAVGNLMMLLRAKL